MRQLTPALRGKADVAVVIYLPDTTFASDLLNAEQNLLSEGEFLPVDCQLAPIESSIKAAFRSVGTDLEAQVVV